MLKENDIIPQELVDDEDIFEVLQELVRDADILALCPTCKVPMAIEEYESANCVQCGSINFEDVLYVYREDDLSKFN